MQRLRIIVDRQRAPIARPVLWVDAAALAAAVLLAVAHLWPTGGAAAEPGGHAHLHGLATTGPAAHGEVVVSWGGWSLMVAAMMLPLSAPLARRVAAQGLWHRRHRTVLEFTAAYLTPWLLVGLAAVVLMEQVSPAGPGVAALATALCLAGAWHVAPQRRRLVRRCGAIRPMALGGLQASVDCARTGWTSGLRCIATCGPAMAPMVVSHNVFLMCAVSVLLWSERVRGPNPEERVGRPAHAVGFALLAAAAPMLM